MRGSEFARGSTPRGLRRRGERRYQGGVHFRQERSSFLSSRGRKERLLCGDHPDGSTLRWVDRLYKQATASNADFAGLERGYGVNVDPPAARVGPDTRVSRA